MNSGIGGSYRVLLAGLQSTGLVTQAVEESPMKVEDEIHRHVRGALELFDEPRRRWWRRESNRFGALAPRGPWYSDVVALEDWVPTYRRRAAVLLGALAFVGAIARPQEQIARGLWAMSFASGLVLWCTLDARMHGKIFLRSYAWTMMFTWPIGMLAYLIWTRRVRGVGVYLLSSGIFIVTMLLGLAAAALLRTR
jgi:hypothetical protein